MGQHRMEARRHTHANLPERGCTLHSGLQCVRFRPSAALSTAILRISQQQHFKRNDSGVNAVRVHHTPPGTPNGRLWPHCGRGGRRDERRVCSVYGRFASRRTHATCYKPVFQGRRSSKGREATLTNLRAVGHQQQNLKGESGRLNNANQRPRRGSPGSATCDDVRPARLSAHTPCGSARTRLQAWRRS